jgi:hypothetical protein
MHGAHHSWSNCRSWFGFQFHELTPRSTYLNKLKRISSLSTFVDR